MRLNGTPRVFRSISSLLWDVHSTEDNLAKLGLSCASHRYAPGQHSRTVATHAEPGYTFELVLIKLRHRECVSVTHCSSYQGSPMQVHEQPCRVCGNSSGRSFFANGFMFHRCANCGTIQKQVSLTDYTAINPTYDPGHYLDSENLETIERFLAVEHKKHELERVIGKASLGNEPRSFLDVGCGMGGFLLAARGLGFDVLGFEPSESHARVAREVFTLPVRSEYFSAAVLGDRKFDVIMLAHVIEHIFSPKPFMADLAGVLKPGGKLIVITPNAGSLISHMSGSGWPMLRPIDHVTLLAKSGAERIVPAGYVGQVTTSEYSWEFASTMISVAKRRLGVGPAANEGGQGASAPPKLRYPGARAQVLKGVLSVFSAPFYACSTLTNNAACITLVVTAPRAE